jgi:hypothetical protein
MKQVWILFWVALFTLLVTLVSCTSNVENPAQLPNPAISKKYSDMEIADFVQDFEDSHTSRLSAGKVKDSGVLLQKFQRDFPNARSVKWREKPYREQYWDKELNDWTEKKEKIYRVKFKINDSVFEAYYEEEGDLLAYNQKIRKGVLQEVAETLNGIGTAILKSL